jgi:deazaflavin-dependent oxidoreductase (nitroreductase family)
MTARERPFVLWCQRWLVNPVARRAARFRPGAAVVETTGRRSGVPRRTPVGGTLEGATFWWVSEFGRRSQYVRNIEADPRVRVQLKGRWYAGTAAPVDDDDPYERLKRLPKSNSAVVRLLGTDLLTMRIDLDRGSGHEAGPGPRRTDDV